MLYADGEVVVLEPTVSCETFVRHTGLAQSTGAIGGVATDQLAHLDYALGKPRLAAKRIPFNRDALWSLRFTGVRRNAHRATDGQVFVKIGVRAEVPRSKDHVVIDKNNDLSGCSANTRVTRCGKIRARQTHV